MHREAWQATVYGAAKSWTRLSTHTHTIQFLHDVDMPFFLTTRAEDVHSPACTFPVIHYLFLFHMVLKSAYT